MLLRHPKRRGVQVGVAIELFEPRDGWVEVIGFFFFVVVVVELPKHILVAVLSPGPE